MKRPEQILQTQIANYLSWALTDGAWFTAIPAGGGGELRGKILKGMGLKAGVPDLLIVHASRSYFVEIKSRNGTLSQAQQATRELLIGAGAGWAEVRSLSQLLAMLYVWGIPILATKPSTERITRALAESLRHTEAERDAEGLATRPVHQGSAIGSATPPAARPSGSPRQGFGVSAKGSREPV